VKNQKIELHPPIVDGGITIERIDIAQYTHPRDAFALCLVAAKGVTHGVMSVNLPEESHKLKPNHFFIKNYSENERIYGTLVAKDILVPTGEAVQTGMKMIPICRFAKEKTNTRCKCFACATIFPSAKAWIWEDNFEPYCPDCANVLRDEDLDPDLGKAESKIDMTVDEDKIRRK
jgi:hypothetical protein